MPIDAALYDPRTQLAAASLLSARTALDTRLTSLSLSLDFVRTGRVKTRADLEDATGLSRKIIAQRVVELTDAGLIDEGELGPSTGGRAPRRLRFRSDAGHVLVAHFGATGVGVALCDLSGRLLSHHHEKFSIEKGPESSMALLVERFDALLASRADKRPLWGIGVGVPGPVEFSTGRPVSPPIMPGWHEYPLREELQARYGAPTWVDNDVNIMAVGELRAGQGRGVRDFVFVKIGTGIGAGVVSAGALHRGAQGVAGDVGHVATRDRTMIMCLCGKADCLEAVAGGRALLRDATTAALTGRSPLLAAALEHGRDLTVADLGDAARHGDQTAIELLTRSGRLVGDMLATVVNFFNPSLVVVGGSVVDASDTVVAAVRKSVYDRSLPLATRDLQITRSRDGARIGLTGAAFMVIDELFSRPVLAQWIGEGTPAGHPELSALAVG